MAESKNAIIIMTNASTATIMKKFGCIINKRIVTIGIPDIIKRDFLLRFKFTIDHFFLLTFFMIT